MGKTIHVSGFHSLFPAELIKLFLEQYTGINTIFALQVKRGKQGSRAYARVQFTSSRYAEMLVDRAKLGLRFGTSCLKVWEQNMDIVPNPRAYEHEMEGVTLNFGCQISQEKFSVLWKAENVSVKFGSKLKNMHLFLCHDSVEYRLQLSSENMWQIILYNSRSQTTKLLLIQLFGAPRIHKKLDDCVHSYFMKTPEDQWVRSTDFTPSCIGQSSGICLQLPRGMELPKFEENFVYYKESETPFALENGVSYCENLDLVPIVQPPQGLELPYRLLFKICTLVQTGCLPGPKLDEQFFRLVQKFEITCLEHVLEKLFYLKECCYDPKSWLLEQCQKYSTFKQPKPPAVTDDIAYIHRVQVTPTKVYFYGPEVNVSNPVLRHFRDHIDNFLRVSFVDEDLSKMYSSDLSPKGAAGDEGSRTKLYERVLSTLRNGIRIGSKKFEFLAFSSSQLRDNSLWMFAPTTEVNADTIRHWMGDFSSIRNVAKYAARLGQSFGSSTETLSVAQSEVDRIPDVEVVESGTTYIFSDGIGKISVDFGRKVAKKCGLKGDNPSAFQIRYGGYKGVVAVDPTSSVKMSLRPSMLKYQSDDTKLNVLGWSKYQPCFLNRQIITLLSTLGVMDHVFEKKQSEAVAQLQEVLVDPLKALEALDLMSLGENTYILKEMLKCGYKPDEEPFLAMMLQTFCSSQLLDLRVKSRIFIPRARQMMGCLDETGTLKYGQVFVQFSGVGQMRFHEESINFNEYTSSDRNFVRGKVVVAKNPCLHPGDLRVLEAIDVPALHHMVDCIVFPQKGERPHPNECSGSDLDGDRYFVCWDPDLIPPKQVQPMNYDPAPATRLDHEVTIEEVQEYFTNYILNESLGMIANAHIVFADKDQSMALSESCLELAELHSVAVDFPKTGVPAQIPPKLHVKEYPDFMEKLDKATYESKRVIGKLFRQVKHVAPNTTCFRFFTREVARTSYDADMEFEGFVDYIDEAIDCKTIYDRKLGNLMDYYGIKTEGEILSRGIMKMSKTFDRRKSAEAIGAAVRSLRSEARTWFKRGGKSRDVAFAKASAWYHVTYHPEYWGRYNEGMKRNHFISFPWCVYDNLVQVKKKNNPRKVAGMTSLGDLFPGLNTLTLI